MSVILQIQVNAGAPSTGRVQANQGDTIQLTAASFTGWRSPVAKWILYDFPDGFAEPAGWSTDATSGYYYWEGNGNPPSFIVTVGHWGKYICRLEAYESETKTTDSATGLVVPSPILGLCGLGAEEDSEFGGDREKWVYDIKRDLKMIDDVIGGTGALTGSSLTLLPLSLDISLPAEGSRFASFNDWTIIANQFGRVLVSGTVIGAETGGALELRADMTNAGGPRVVIDDAGGGAVTIAVPTVSFSTSGEVVELVRTGTNAWDLRGTGSEVVSVNGVVPGSGGVTIADDGAFIGPQGAADQLPTVIMFNGQSNMAAVPALTLGWSELTTLLGADILGFGYAANAFAQVVDGTCNARANNGGTGTGPGPGLGQVGTRLARYLADATGQTIRTYAGAYTGQPISVFLPASGTMAKFEDGTSHPSLNNYDWLQSMVTTTGVVPTDYVWIQGEADAGRTQAAQYADLETLRAALRTDYPGIRIWIVTTIGNADDRIGNVTTQMVSGVRAAERQLARENPDHVHIVDTIDMRGHSAWFADTHYAGGPLGTATYAGYEEVARRIFAAMRGEQPRPKVEPADHPARIYAFDHYWAHRRSMTSVTSYIWSDDVGSDSLTIENGTPEHIYSDPNFAGRSVIRFVRADSERLTETSIAGGNRWFFFVVARVDPAALGTGSNVCIWQLETSGAPATNRIAFNISTSGGYRINLNGADTAFTTPATPAPETGGVARSYAVSYDGDAGEAKLWINGTLVATQTGLANVDTGAAARIRIGSFSASAHFGGEIAVIGCKAEPSAMPTDDEVAAMHAGARVEYGLET